MPHAESYASVEALLAEVQSDPDVFDQEIEAVPVLLAA
jgi:hypothetical protein